MSQPLGMLILRAACQQCIHRILESRWHVGASLTVPSGFGNSYGKLWSGRYLAEESELASASLAGTVAYRLSDHWSIGGGPLMMHTDSTSKARINNLAGDDDRIKGSFDKKYAVILDAQVIKKLLSNKKTR